MARENNNKDENNNNSPTEGGPSLTIATFTEAVAPSHYEKPTKRRGRPKTGLKVLPAGWKDEVLDIYGKGGSDAEVRVYLRSTGMTLSTDLWYRWMEEEPNFSETIHTGQDLSEAWWQTVGRGLAVGAMKGNAAVWTMNMRNRFAWQNDVELSAKLSINPLDAIADEYSSTPIYDTTTRELVGPPERPPLEAE